MESAGYIAPHRLWGRKSLISALPTRAHVFCFGLSRWAWLVIYGLLLSPLACDIAAADLHKTTEDVLSGGAKSPSPINLDSDSLLHAGDSENLNLRTVQSSEAFVSRQNRRREFHPLAPTTLLAVLAVAFVLLLCARETRVGRGFGGPHRSLAGLGDLPLPGACGGGGEEANGDGADERDANGDGVEDVEAFNALEALENLAKLSETTLGALPAEERLKGMNTLFRIVALELAAFAGLADAKLESRRVYVAAKFVELGNGILGGTSSKDNNAKPLKKVLEALREIRRSPSQQPPLDRAQRRLMLQRFATLANEASETCSSALEALSPWAEKKEAPPRELQNIVFGILQTVHGTRLVQALSVEVVGPWLMSRQQARFASILFSNRETESALLRTRQDLKEDLSELGTRVVYLQFKLDNYKKGGSQATTTPSASGAGLPSDSAPGPSSDSAPGPSSDSAPGPSSDSAPGLSSPWVAQHFGAFSASLVRGPRHPAGDDAAHQPGGSGVPTGPTSRFRFPSAGVQPEIPGPLYPQGIHSTVDWQPRARTLFLPGAMHQLRYPSPRPQRPGQQQPFWTSAAGPSVTSATQSSGALPWPYQPFRAAPSHDLQHGIQPQSTRLPVPVPGAIGGIQHGSLGLPPEESALLVHLAHLSSSRVTQQAGDPFTQGGTEKPTAIFGSTIPYGIPSHARDLPPSKQESYSPLLSSPSSSRSESPQPDEPGKPFYGVAIGMPGPSSTADLTGATSSFGDTPRQGPDSDASRAILGPGLPPSQQEQHSLLLPPPSASRPESPQPDKRGKPFYGLPIGMPRSSSTAGLPGTTVSFGDTPAATWDPFDSIPPHVIWHPDLTRGQGGSGLPSSAASSSLVPEAIGTPHSSAMTSSQHAQHPPLHPYHGAPLGFPMVQAGTPSGFPVPEDGEDQEEH